MKGKCVFYEMRTPSFYATYNILRVHMAGDQVPLRTRHVLFVVEKVEI